jgi:hypothetical protein
MPPEVEEESEPEARGSAKRRRGRPLWYMEYEPLPGLADEWASRLSHARSCEYPSLTIDERILGRLELTNKGEYAHVVDFLKYKERLHQTEFEEERLHESEYEFLRALFVAPMVEYDRVSTSLRSEYSEPVEIDRDWKQGHEIGDVMGDLAPERGVARYIVARRDVVVARRGVGSPPRPWAELPSFPPTALVA